MDLELIKRALEQPGKSRKGLAQAMGRQPSMVTDMLNGRRQIKANELPVIAKYLDLDLDRVDFLYRMEPADKSGLLPGAQDHIDSSQVAVSIDRPPGPKVRVVGYVGAGSAAHYYAVSDEDYEEVEAPPGATDQTVAVEIRGKSLGPFFDTWLVFYRDVRSPVGPELYGRICVVGLADDRILIKKIHHNRDGSFTLISNSGDPPIENAQIEWAAKVTDMRPKDEG